MLVLRIKKFQINFSTLNNYFSRIKKDETNIKQIN